MYEIKDYLASDKPMESVIVKGWVRTVRELKNVFFVELNDGSAMKNLQIVFQENFKDLHSVKKLTTGSSISVKGNLIESPAKGQRWEFIAQELTVYCINNAESYVLQKKRHSFEFLRTVAHLRPRTNTYGAVFRTRSTLAYAIHKFFYERGFHYIQAPIITASDCEGAGQLFQVTTLPIDSLIPKKRFDFQNDFFGKKAYLSVSGQLEAEIMALALGKVYTFAPTFRAENSNTSRHLAEFWMIEPEMSFYELNDDMQLAEEMIKFIIDYTMKSLPDEFEFFNQWIDKGLINKLSNLLDSSFEHITYTESVSILEKSGKNFTYPVKWGIDLQSEHERYITEEYFKKPVFVTDYPKDIKAFYMKQNSDGKTVRAMDLLVPQIGEIIGGSQREDDYDALIQAMKEKKLPEENYWWYLDLRKYGSVPHSGFGLGFERLMQFISGMENIRDVIPFHRAPGSADF